MMSAKKINILKFAKTWLFAVMILSFISCMYAAYTKSAWQTFGTLAAFTSLLYIALVLNEFLEEHREHPLFKHGDDNE